MGTTIRTLFTVEEANQILPLVRSIVRDIVEDFRHLRHAGRERRAIEVQSAGRRATGHLEDLKEQVDAYSSRIEGYLRELAELGLEVRDLELGLVDFPSLIDGEPAYLSWRLDEERVSWWHPADRGFSDRAPVPEVSLDLRPRFNG
jgi:hypothetical protein